VAARNESSTAAFAPADEVLVITRIFDAPRELVFKLWTDPDHAMKWWGPRDYGAAVCGRPKAVRNFGTAAYFVKSSRPIALSSHSRGMRTASAGLKPW
jgi:Activator of Hsp90 ATPase homolog 1-like protein